MDFLWPGLLLVAIIFALLCGNGSALSAAALDGAQTGVTLALSLTGAICLWSGVGALAERSGLSGIVSKLFSPFLRRVFPQAWQDCEAKAALGGNFSANLLGLGNAATPLGLKAVKRMQTLSGKAAASDEMCRLIVLNTASIQLLPTTVAALRAAQGAAQPFSILTAVWCSSVMSVAAGLTAAKALEGVWKP